jgi:hypothetical protein
MDLRKITRWVGRLLLSAGLAAGTFLGMHGVAQAADVSQPSVAVETVEGGDSTSTTMDDPIWT